LTSFSLKVLIDENNQAYGIQYEKSGKTFSATARKEVILSAGTVNSAKLLMLSGLGPRKHLEETGIKVIKNLPVGLNLQDHIGVFLHPFFINSKKTSKRQQTLSIKLDRDLTPRAMYEWLRHGRGVLSSSGVQATGCISSSFAKARGEGDWPDIHYFLFGFSASSRLSATVSKAFNLREEEMLQYYAHADGKESFYIIVTGARPFSRGNVKLRSNDPRDSPLIDPRYLEDSEDVDLKVKVLALKFYGTRFES
jgi:choline dehydrogenase-like flavoprotein